MAAPPQKEPWPAPPSLYLLYDPKKQAAGATPPSPPPLPAKELTFLAFGLQQSQVEPLIPDLRTERLYHTQLDGSVDYKGELQRLNRELLFLVLEVLKTLVDNPSSYASQLTVINKVMSNMQYLINTLRPQQALANMEYSLKRQIKACEESIHRIRMQTTAADDLVKQLAEALTECCSSDGSAGHLDGNPDGDSKQPAVALKGQGTPAGDCMDTDM